jgi:iron complex outermembrane recepter protein
MKNCLFAILLFVGSELFSQQTFIQLKEPNASVISNAIVDGENKFISKTDGTGQLDISKFLKNDSLRFSIDGFQAINIKWNPSIKSIQLKRVRNQLKETRIKGSKPQIKIEAGKIALDASQATIQQGNIKDLLLQIPGVYVDNNNSITVRGKDGFRILIDGKTSQLALSDMKTFLASIPAGSVKSIEVLTNPGAQYDAQGKGGIILIKLKKEKKEGYHAKVNAGAGSLLNKYIAGFNGNYRNDRFNLFGNYNFNYNDQWYGYSESRESDYQGIKKNYNYKASWENIVRTHSLNSGVDFFLNPSLTLSYTADLNFSFNNGKNHQENPSYELDENGTITKKYLASNFGKNDIYTLSNTISMRKTYDSSDMEWNIDMSHTMFSEFNANTNENFAFSPNGNDLISDYYYFEPILDNQVQNIMAKADVILPTKFTKLEFGLKNEANFNRNDYKAYLKEYYGIKYMNPKYINQFNYNDNVFASYINATKTINNTNFGLGLRAENTVISSNNDDVSRQYLNFFPNISITTPLDSFITLSGRYSRRIERPKFNQLNNRIIYYNRYTANVGVPNLQPELADVLSINIDRTYWSGRLNLTIGSELSKNTNEISEINFIDSTYTSFFTYGNVGKADLFSLFLNLYCKPIKNLEVNLTPTYQYSAYRYTANNILNESSGSGFMLSGMANYTFKNDLKISFNGFMNTRMIWAQGYSAFLGTINGSISKSFLNKKLSLELSCQDIFNSNIWSGFQTTGNIRSSGIWKPETRIAWLNLSYSFGKVSDFKRKEIEKSDRIKATGR